MPTLVRRRLPMLIILLLIIGGVLVACGGPATTNTPPEPTPTDVNPTPVSQSQEVNVGSPAIVQQVLLITVKKPKMSSGDASVQLQKTSDVFLIFAVSIKNTSKQEQQVPSATLFSLTDSSGTKYAPVSDPKAGVALQGTVPAGGLVHGVLVYEVPNSLHTFQVILQQTSGQNLSQTIWDGKV